MEGRIVGSSEKLTLGTEDGNKLVSKDGELDGVHDGSSECSFDGMVDGISDGVSLSFKDGVSEGTKEGSSECSLEGRDEGLFEGLLLLIDGDSEGPDDGNAVGLKEGIIDGPSLLENVGMADGFKVDNKDGGDDGDSDELPLVTLKVSARLEPNSAPSSSVLPSNINFQ